MTLSRRCCEGITSSSQAITATTRNSSPLGEMHGPDTHLAFRHDHLPIEHPMTQPDRFHRGNPPLSSTRWDAYAQHALEVLEHQEQVVRVSRAGLEFPRLVPLPRCIVLGMDQQAANACDVGSLSGAQQRILEQGLAQTFTLMLFVHCEPGQDHDWYRITRQPLHHSRRRGLGIDTADRQTVEADHHVLVAADVGLGAVGLLVDERVALQELVQRGMAAVESIDLIRRKQLANG